MYLFDFNQDASIPGQAAIDFQISSSLGKQLSALFQTVIEFKQNIDYSSVPNTELEHRKYRISAVNEFFKNSISEKFKKIVSKETGLIVTKLYEIGGETSGISGFFAVDLTFGDWRAALEMQDRITATGNQKYGSSKKVVEEFQEMAANLDLSTGKLKSPIFGKNRQIAVSIYFDVNAAFLVDDFLPAKFAIPFTAGEVAAIMMHEIGHGLTIVEHSANMYATHQRLSATVRNLKNESDVRGAIALLSSDLLPILKSLKTNIPKGAKTGDAIGKIVNTLVAGLSSLRTLSESDAPERESWLFTAGSLTVNLLLFGVIAISLTIISLCYFIYGGWLFYELSRTIYVDSNSGGDKSSDVTTNFNNTFLIERWADEYVSRHGYGAELASGLNKIDAYFKYGTIGTITSARLRNSTVFNFLCIVFSDIMDKIQPISYLDPHGYEDQFSRLSRVLQNTYGFFKDEDIPGVVVDQWLRSVETIKAQMKIAKTMSDTAAGKAFYNTLRNMTSPIRWIQLIDNGNLARDTEILANRIDDLSNNPFFHIAAKLKSLR